MDEKIIDILVEEEQDTSDVIETVQIIEVEDVVAPTIEVEEAFASEAEQSPNFNHALLNNRDISDQHPITAITGLRQELDEIETIKTVYSDKIGFANYYEWNNAAYDEVGYFVSMVPGTSMIKVCDGRDVFGVTVDFSGFIGGENTEEPRDNKYGLVVTSGVVDVRCELDISVGDYVISNERGIAKKTSSNCGYKVIARENKNGIEYVVILLGVQADVTDLIGRDIQGLKERIYDAETNIVSAINVANAAHNKASESDKVSTEAILKALEAMQKADDANTTTDNMNDVLMSVSGTAAQAKAIAESAVTSATTMKDEAIQTANDAWTEVNTLTETLNPILSWKDDVSGVSGVEYLTTHMDQGLATTAEIREAESKTEKVMSVVQKNAKELQSLVTTIDKYSIGEYSQANGLTLEQAQSILEIGMIYVPTNYHKESYESEKSGAYEREFTQGYLYRWDNIPNSDISIGWLTIGEAPSVYFSSVEPILSERLEYWYTDSDVITDKDGNTGTYESYTLYKWEEDHWFAVATLNGNVNNRAISQVRQTANSVAFEVFDARGSFSGMKAELSDTNATVASNAFWKNDDGSQYVATFEQKSGGDGSSLALIARRIDTTDDEEQDASVELKGANIVLGQGNEDSYISIDAERILLNGETILTSPDGNGETKINGGYIDATSLSVDAANITGTLSVKDYKNRTLFSAGDGLVSVGGWNVDTNSLYSGSSFSSAECFLCTGSGGSMKIGGSDEINGWTLKAGEHFGVTKYGTLYCDEAHISGYIFAKSGTIGENCSVYGTLKANNISANSLDLINDYDCTYDVESQIYHKASSESSVGDLVIGGYHIISNAKFASNFPGQTTSTSIPQASVFVGIEPYNFNSYYGPEPVIELATRGYLFDAEQAPSSKNVTRLRMAGAKGTLHGDWYIVNNLISNASIQITSDYNMKNSIDVIPDNYDAFYNKLEPSIYKYNDGTSDRYHIGFIAQTTKAALEEAGLTLQDFAGICIENQGTDEEVWRLRYEEFIALNTWKIQQLEKRIEQMEKKYE